MDENVTEDKYFCGNSTFWSDDVFSGPAPNFTDCFQITALSWIPVTWLILTLPYYTYLLLSKDVAYSLPITLRSVAKSVLCICFTSLVLLEVWSADNYGYHCHSNQTPPTAFYVATTVNACVYLFVAVFIQFLRMKSVVSSSIIFTFWVLTVLCGIIPLQSKISYQSGCPSSTIYFVYYGLVVAQLVLHCFADVSTPSGYQYLGKQQCPDGEASTFSYWIFWWFNPIILKAYKGTLQQESLWENTTSLQYDTVVKDFNIEWNKEIRKHIKKKKPIKSLTKRRKEKNYLNSNEETPLLSSQESYQPLSPDVVSAQKPSLYRTLCHLYGITWFWGAMVNVFGVCSMLLQPYILRLLIDYIENGKKGDEPKWIGYALAVGMALAGETTSLFFNHSMNICMTLGLRIKTALIGTIYQKALTMSNASKGDYTTGEIVNLMSVVCLRIQNAFIFANWIIGFWFFLGIGLYQMWDLMGVATLGGVAVIVVLAFLNAVFGKLQQIYQKELLKQKGTRIKILSEVLQGIKVLKMYAWEPWFSEKILSVRRKEMRYLRSIALVTAFSVLCSVHSPFFMNYFIILIYILMTSSQAFDATKAFGSLSLVNILRYPLTLIPFVILGCVQAYVSVGRIQSFLWKEDVKLENVSFVEDADYAITIQNGVFSWDPENPLPTIKGVNVNVMEGKLYAIVGQVGSGKSSVISAILGEMEKLQGNVMVKGSVAYVPQEAWIQNLTVRDNILFGNRYIEKKYNRIIQACALEPDLKVLSAGDMTEIGQKGIDISGGQKQRVSLARAVYSNADVYLLDDPLSAVDSHVGKDLFTQVIGPDGILRHKTRILVTHGVHWLPKVDVVIVMEDGVISEMGSYEELIHRRGAFAEFLENVLIYEEESDDEEDPEIAKMKDAMWEQVEAIVSDGNISEYVEGLSRRQSIRKLSRRNSSVVDVSKRMSRKYSRALSKELPKTKQKEDEPKEGQLIKEETSEEGNIKIGVTFTYIRAVGVIFSILIILFMSGFQGCNIAGNFWLTFWTEDEYLRNTSLRNTTETHDRNINYLLIYTVFGIIQAVCLLLYGLTAFLRIVKAAGELHSNMLYCVLRSPMSFFDTTPVGRIMNRFSSDVDVLDDVMPRTFRLWCSMFFSLFSIIIVISINTPAFLIAIVPVGILYIAALRFYLPTARQLKRIESVTRSPVFNHFSETIAGASVIRAYRCSDRFVEECSSRVNKNCSFFYAANTSARWIGLRLEFLGNLLVLAASVFAVVSPSLSGADVGLSLTYSMQLIIVLNYVIQAVSEMEMNIVSVERINEYTKLSPEAEWILPSSRPPHNWPQAGKVLFQNYATRYREGLELVLKGIHCEINPGEKVGIVGRTGAGKSSLTLSLFRLIEGAGGSIIIDGVSIADLGLHDLRSRITILPQDPVIFSGTLRSNLDPLERFSDEEIWTALDCAHLRSFVNNQPIGLLYECGEGGLNLSIGQRQLVCLGRALLNKTKILILDEATAAVDMETDELIQNTIRTEFKECTVLSIAHRLNTIMDYDRIMVLDKGKIIEMDSPDTLLHNTQGVFYGMAKDAGLVNNRSVSFIT